MAPEMTVRRLIHSLGYRYRLHCKDLPGKPDIVFKSRRKIIFVHGCFWHQHSNPNCDIARVPKSHLDYWLPKLQRNIDRDAAAIKELKQKGWEVAVIWECELKDIETVCRKLINFLG